MQEKPNFSPDLIRQYCDYFYEIAIKAVFVTGTDIRFKSIEFDAGVILQIILQPKTDHPGFDNIRDESVPYYCYTSILEAFKELQIDVDDYLSENHQLDLIKAINNNVSYFEGTLTFYGQTMNEIFLIKEKKKHYGPLTLPNKT